MRGEKCYSLYIRYSEIIVSPITERFPLVKVDLSITYLAPSKVCISSKNKMVNRAVSEINSRMIF